MSGIVKNPNENAVVPPYGDKVLGMASNGPGSEPEPMVSVPIADMVAAHEHEWLPNPEQVGYICDCGAKLKTHRFADPKNLFKRFRG